MEIKGEGIPNIVVPTIREQEHFEKFLVNWEKEFEGCHLIVVEDRKKKKLEKLIGKYVKNFTVYDWSDIDKDLKENSWIIPRKTDCVRSYGYLKAYQNNPLFIVTLDDDIMPFEDNHIETFAKKLFYDNYPDNNFYNTMRKNLPRGTYNYLKGVDVVHGGWLNVPDFSAEEQIKNKVVSTENDFNMGVIPKNSFFSLCGMNIAWKPHVTKDIYFGLQGYKYPVDRCGDIWAGYTLSNKGYDVYTGEPFCYHTRASNIWSNLKKERDAEYMSYLYLSFLEDRKVFDYVEYFELLKEAYKIWRSYFK